MKVTIAADSFKGSLTTHMAGDAIACGIKRVYKDAEVFVRPLADGGEGTVDALTGGKNGEIHTVIVHNPIGELIESSYGIIRESGTAVIEMAAAAGITLISEKDRNPMNTTTYGVGELILDAVENGCRKFIIGIGGSATNDGGIGMLQALGFEFLNTSKEQVPWGAKGLKEISEISDKNAVPELKECKFYVACDVKNPLCGENGCSAVYGPQKGATPEMILEMDSFLKQYAKLTKAVNKAADAEFPGAGAAGGLGFALMTYLGARLESGIELVIRETNLEDYIKNSDIVVTGEGRLDGQSYMGKAPVGVASLAKKYNKPVIAFAGCVTADAKNCNAHGIDAFFQILKAPCSLEEAMNPENARVNLADMAEQVFSLIKSMET